MVNPESLPQELIGNGLFCCWRYEKRDGQEKLTKVPYNPVTGLRAKPDNPETFTSFQHAMEKAGAYHGIGFRVANGFCAMDLDHCFEADGTLKPWSQYILDTMRGCYMEKSPSGKGLRIIFKSGGFQFDRQKYYINNQKLGLEIYIAGFTNRFVTVTGDIYSKGDILEMAEGLQTVLDKYMVRPVAVKVASVEEAVSFLSDETIMEKAFNSKNGSDFSALWGGNISNYASHSEADLALCSKLAFWCGADIGQMDRLFRQSGLMREKWDRVQSGSSYGQITLRKAASSVTEVYSPGGKRSPAAIDFMKEDDMLSALQPHDNPRYAWSDIGSGYLFSDRFKNIARYIPERKLWYTYNGVLWQPDIGNLNVMELCKKLADELMVYALSITDERIRKAYIDFVRRWQARKSRETILKDASSVYPVAMTCFDKDPYLFNCQNGTLNLIDGTFHEHSAEDMLSKAAGVNYDRSAVCERWERFINEIMIEDLEKALFLQKALGYALTGDTKYEALFILFGPTSRNGKGTACETFLRIIGDYGRTARPESIGMKFNSSSGNPTEDIARLAGSRFVNISEPDKKLVLSAALVKSLTGNDSINARFLHENSFDFKPQFKLFINCNYLPQVTDLTLFHSGRVKIIPFERHFEESDQDHSLKATFAKPENLSGILNWCIKGYHLMVKEGLKMPESVRLATDAYQHSSDKIGLFIEDCMEPDPRAEVRTAEVYSEYKSWCMENGYRQENVKNFNAALRSIMPIERRRPRDGGAMTTMITGHKLLYGFDKVAPL